MKAQFLTTALLFALCRANAQPCYISNIQVSKVTGEYKRVMDILSDPEGGDLQ